MRPALVLLGLFTLTLGCLESPSPGPVADESIFDMAGADAEVTLFDSAHLYYLPGDDQRAQDVQVELPDEGLHASIELDLTLRCPAVGGCDAYDRLGSVTVVEGEGDEEHEIEIARFITPFGMGAELQFELTRLAPLLRGKRTLRTWISTGVGPGSPMGAGWIVDATLRFDGGVPDDVPMEVVSLWNASAPYGDPDVPYQEMLGTQLVIAPEASTHIELVALTTGHGQGNKDGCAEFCPRWHDLVVGERTLTDLIWRDDCESTAVQDQPGTWKFSRAGWCPGATVEPWGERLRLDEGEPSLEVRYDMEVYENSCRPEAETCAGCSLGTGCDYDGGLHTKARVRVSALAVFTRPAARE